MTTKVRQSDWDAQLIQELSPTKQRSVEVRRAFALSILKAIELEAWLSGKRTHNLDKAFYLRSADQPGTVIIYAATDSGSLLLDNAVPLLDAQSEYAGRVTVSLSAPDRAQQMPRQEATVEESWEAVRDTNRHLTERIEALQDLTLNDKEQLAEYLVQEFQSPSLPSEWENALVFAAEDVSFAEDTSRLFMLNRLLEIASRRRLDSRAGSDRVVWSSIRRAASLLASAEATRLSPFLDRTGPIDTRAVVLQCIYRIFERSPATPNEALFEMGQRISHYATKFLDQDVFSGGEIAALAQNSVCALAAIGDSRLITIVPLVNMLRRRWLNHQIRSSVEHLAESWAHTNPLVVSHEPYQLLIRFLSQLASL